MDYVGSGEYGTDLNYMYYYSSDDRLELAKSECKGILPTAKPIDLEKIGTNDPIERIKRVREWADIKRTELRNCKRM